MLVHAACAIGAGKPLVLLVPMVHRQVSSRESLI